MLYDIVLPLAVEGVLTYNIPNSNKEILEYGGNDTDDITTAESVSETAMVGRRVLVPIGKRKIMTGIIVAKHNEPISNNVSIKDAICFLDDSPIVTKEQLQLWQWIADYYMCTLGEVMRAALPTALRLESETHIAINPDYITLERLSQTQQHILDILSDGKEKTLDEIGKNIGIISVISPIKKLQEKGAIIIGEQVEEKYKPKMEAWIKLSDNIKKESQLQTILDSLCKAKKQEQLLLRFLQFTEEKRAKSKEGDLKNKEQKLRKEELLSLTGASPSTLKSLIDKHIFTIEMLPKQRLSVVTQSAEANPLSEMQEEAKRNISLEWEHRDICLLHGVTGSGKTEIYINLIQEIIRNGKQVLYLVPEIALTTQLQERLLAVFGNDLGVYHSRFSDNERIEIYQNILKGRYKVVLGVRSALFLPYKQLGLVIVDEEHDSSYKQQDPAPRYHGRNVAIVLAKLFNCKTLLGTATPSIETYYYAQTGKYGLVSLNQRHRNIQMPHITIIDTKEHYRRKEMYGHFADPMIERISAELEKNKQVLVFQNRRGYAPWIECKQCAYVPKCPNCDVSLTLHNRRGTLVCHYCGYTTVVPARCPACGEATLTDHGTGTEKIEDELQELFPQARIARMDLDTTRSKYSYQRIIDDIATHKIDILVGTQMITKGLHFDDVSTVAVLSADSLMNQPDFRSYERAYQMLEQVSGRAGRKHEQGEVLIQTNNPENNIIKYVAEHDYLSFYKNQITEREDFKYPPFYRLILLTIKHRDATKAEKVAQMLQEQLSTVFTRRCSRVMQPAISKVKNMYLRQILLKIENDAPFYKAKQLVLKQIQQIKVSAEGKSAVIQVDVDPQ